jgi:hypothetical protein
MTNEQHINSAAIMPVNIALAALNHNPKRP